MSRPSLQIKGFTLIEIVFGMALLAVASIAFISSYELLNRSKRSLSEDSITATLAAGVHKILTNQTACDLNFDSGVTMPAAPATLELTSLGFPERGSIPAQDFIATGSRFMNTMDVDSITLSSTGPVATVDPTTYLEAFRLQIQLRRPTLALTFGSPVIVRSFDFVAKVDGLPAVARDFKGCLVTPSSSGSSGLTPEQACQKIRGTYISGLCDVGPGICEAMGVPFDGIAWPTRCDPAKLRERLMANMVGGKGCDPGQFVKGFNIDGTPICLAPSAIPSPIRSPITTGCNSCYLSMPQPCAVAQLNPMPTPSPTGSYVPQIRLFESGLLIGTQCIPSPDPTLLPPKCLSENPPCGP